MVYKYAVGKPYNPDRLSWPETPMYNFRHGGHELLLFYSSPTPSEIEAVKKGLARIEFLEEDGIIFVLYRFKKGGKVVEGDSPFSIHQVPEEQRTVPEPIKPGESILLQVILVDANTGIIRAMRAVSPPVEIAVGLMEAIIAQAGKPHPDDYDEKIQEIYGKYPDTESMFQAAWKK